MPAPATGVIDAAPRKESAVDGVCDRPASLLTAEWEVFHFRFSINKAGQGTGICARSLFFASFVYDSFLICARNENTFQIKKTNRILLQKPFNQIKMASSASAGAQKRQINSHQESPVRFSLKFFMTLPAKQAKSLKMAPGPMTRKIFSNHIIAEYETSSDTY